MHNSYYKIDQINSTVSDINNNIKFPFYIMNLTLKQN